MLDYFVGIKFGLLLILSVFIVDADDVPKVENETINPGTTAKLNCNLRKGVKVQYKWWKNGQEVTQTKRRKLNKKGILLIKQFKSEDQGLYICRNHSNTILKRVLLKLGDVPEIENYTINPGRTAKLNCNPRKGVKIQHMWWKNGKEVTQTKRRKLNKKGILVIKQFKSEDQGLYICRNHSNTILKRVLLKLGEFHGKPVFGGKDSIHLSRYAFAGNKIDLECIGEGTLPIRYRWTKNGRPLMSAKYKIDGPQMKIDKLVLLDSGNYTCIASNVYGSSNCSITVKVCEVIRAKPFLRQGFPRDTRAVVGENASMECFELFSNKMGTIVDFRWLLWRRKPNYMLEKELIALVLNGNFTNPFVKTLFDPLYYESIARTENDILLYGSKINLFNVTKQNDGYYSCIACTSLGCAVRSARLTVIDEIVFITAKSPVRTGGKMKGTNSVSKNKGKSEENNIYIIVSISGALLVLTFIIIFVAYRRILKQEKRRESIEETSTDANLNKKDLIIKFHSNNGNSLASLETTTTTTTTTPLMQKTRNGSDSLRSRIFQPRLQHLSSPVSASVCLEMMDIPLDRNWEIEKENLVLGETLGEGAFGVVVKAEALSLPSKVDSVSTVAVKMLKADATEHEFHDLLSEMETMKQIGKHKNIINFLGCCTQNGTLCIVVEYAPYGNLRQYLRSNRPSITESSDGSSDATLTLATLISFAFQIAKGMEFLAGHQCIHRDLAARNVLVGENYVMKIADFGLARNVREADYYRKTTDGRLPIKWLSIEALFDRVYTTQSDVWAYGVVLWEIFTLGGSPYPSIPVEKLFKLLKSGFRMKRPQGCPADIYEIMLECWYESANLRPKFVSLVNRLELCLENATVNEYIQVFADSMNCIHEEEEEEEEEEDEKQESDAAESEESANEETLFNALEESTL